MKIEPTFFLFSLLAAMLLACNQSSPTSDSADSFEPGKAMSRAVLAKAVVMQAKVYGQPSEINTTHLREAGVCQGYIDFYEELVRLSQAPPAGFNSFSPKFRRAIECLTGASLESMTSNSYDYFAASMNNIAKMDKCLCGSSIGSIFGRNAESAYAAWRSTGSVGGGGYSAAVAAGGDGYQAPASAGGDSYQAPGSAGGQGYQGPSN